MGGEVGLFFVTPSPLGTNKTALNRTARVQTLPGWRNHPGKWAHGRGGDHKTVPYSNRIERIGQ